MEGGLPVVTKHPHRRREEGRLLSRRGPPELAGRRAWRELASARLGGSELEDEEEDEVKGRG
uniref:Uncharacterized protein n=1 Tax=Oryza sativa subsp. japonica TaxID=39947 RepID=Q6H5P5_ORYSJ|nr:hypothetical protein [Oryza sativa Japonica Group]BAD25954.1 hypothetical protein [Oryza sativa Japonica Group]